MADVSKTGTRYRLPIAIQCSRVVKKTATFWPRNDVPVPAGSRRKTYHLSWLVLEPTVPGLQGQEQHKQVSTSPSQILMAELQATVLKGTKLSA